MIEIVDKVNHITTREENSLELTIDPAGNVIYLKDLQVPGQRIVGITHYDDGTSMVFYAAEVIDTRRRGMQVSFSYRKISKEAG